MFGPVSARQHAAILDMIVFAGFVIGVLMIAIMGLDAAMENVVGLVVYAVSVILLYQIVWHFLPVRCSRPGCEGFMHREPLFRSDGIWLRYVCDSCMRVFEKCVGSNREGPPSLYD